MLHSHELSSLGVPQQILSEGDNERVVVQQIQRPLSYRLASVIPRKESTQASLRSRALAEGAHHPAPNPPPPVLHRQHDGDLVSHYMTLPPIFHGTTQPAVGAATEGLRDAVCPQRLVLVVGIKTRAEQYVSNRRHLHRCRFFTAKVRQVLSGEEGRVIRPERPSPGVWVQEPLPGGRAGLVVHDVFERGGGGGAAWSRGGVVGGVIISLKRR